MRRVVTTRRFRPGEADGYIYGLDLVRFAAALAVAVFHLSWQVPGLWRLMPVGWIGVQVFFVLSGFVIAKSASQATPLSFCEGRIARLYPAAWACAVIGAVAIVVLRSSQANVGVAAMLSGPALVHSLLLVDPPFIASAYWTLPVEIAFYAMVLALMAAGHGARLDRLAIGLLLWSAPYILALSAASAGLVTAPWLDLGYGLPNASLLRHGPYFALGILLWTSCRDRAGALRLTCMAVAAALAALEIGCRAQEVVGRFPVPVSSIGSWFVAVLAWVLCCVAIWRAAAGADRFPASAGIRLVTRRLGLVTYPFYLLHETVGGNVMGAMVGRGVAAPVALAAGLAVTGGASYAVAVYWEPAARSWLKALFRRLRTIRPVASISMEKIESMASKNNNKLPTFTAASPPENSAISPARR